MTAVFVKCICTGCYTHLTDLIIGIRNLNVTWPDVYVTWCHMIWSHLNSCSWTRSDIQLLQLTPDPCRLIPLEKEPEYEAGLQQETTCLWEGVARGGRERNRKGCEGQGGGRGQKNGKRWERGKGIQKLNGNRENVTNCFHYSMPKYVQQQP